MAAALLSATASIRAAEAPRLDARTILLSHTADPAQYVFSDPLEAITYINSSGQNSVTMYVAPSVYWLDDPDDPAVRRSDVSSQSVPYAAEIACDTLCITGLAENPEDVVFAVNRGQTQGALGNYTMIHFRGKSLRLSNMTFGNYCNADLVYPRDPSLNRPKRRDAIVQAQVGICEGTDRLYADNCRFISRLNLCPFVGARRSLYEDCYFECTDDALSGSAVYLGCRFTFFSGKPFYSTASTGAVFLDCDIHTLVSGTQYFTKVPGPVTVIDTRITSDNPVSLQWTRDDSPVHCYQSGVILNGHQVVIDASRPSLSTDITALPVMNAYRITKDGKTIYNIPNLLGGDDGWDPLGSSAMIGDAGRLPVTMRLTPSTNNLTAIGDTVEITTSPRLWGNYPTENIGGTMRWNAPTTLKLLSASEALVAVSDNSFPKEADVRVTASDAYGLTASADLHLAPYLTDAPGFMNMPKLEVSKGTMKLSYILDSDNGTDESAIIWYRSTRPDLSDSVAVLYGRGRGALQYQMSRADEGCYISATVRPKLDTTVTGEASIAVFGRPVSKLMLLTAPRQEKRLFTTFAEIPIRDNGAGRKGTWNFDTYKPADTSLHDWTPDSTRSWYYGHGVDAATGIGIVQATKGARLSYTPVRDKSRKMTVNLIAEPAKGPGQGFGSATGQYMDIGVKFDPMAMSGYALRIERTPEFDKAVTFTLVRYDNGAVTPVSDSVASDCYRTPCHITVTLDNDRLSASAYTDAAQQPHTNPLVRAQVELEAGVTPTPGSSLYIQHTGSVGASATLLREMEITWE